MPSAIPPIDRRAELVALLLALASRAGPKPTPLRTALIGEWRVERIRETPVVEGSPTTLTFDTEGRVHGNAGVNRMSGQWSLEEARLAFSPLATTRMAGPPALMDQEHRLLSALGEVAGLSVEGDGLVLTSGAGEPLVRATR